MGLHAVNTLNRYPVAMAIAGRLGHWLILLLSDPVNVANAVLWTCSAITMKQATRWHKYPPLIRRSLIFIFGLHQTALMIQARLLCGQEDTHTEGIASNP